MNEEEHCYKIDHSLFKELETNDALKMEFLRHLLDHFSLEYNFEMPDSIRNNCEYYLKANDGVAQFVDEFIVKDPEGHFTLKEAKELFTRQEYFNKRIGTLKTDLEKLIKTICYAQKWINNKNVSNVFLGYRIRSDHDECRF